MADYGVTTSGFVRKRLPEQLQEIFDEMKAGFGEDVSLSPDTVLGVLSNITAERFTAIWEEMEAVYSAMYPMSATGSNLDRAVSFTGVKRLQEQPSVVDVVWYGQEGTEIPDYTAVKNTQSQTTYYSNGGFTITKSKAYDVELTLALAKVNVGDTLKLTLDGVTYSYTADRSSTTYAIEKLGLLLKNIPHLSVNTSGITLKITAYTVPYFQLEVVQGLRLIKLGTTNEVMTEGASDDLAEVGVMNEAVNKVTGLDEVNNLNAGTAGRYEETDAELYARYHLGVYRTGAGTIESLSANLATVKGVSAVLVYENDSKTADSYGTPANSIHCIVKGGLDKQIAQTILSLKPAGIPTFGSTAVNVKDSQGFNKLIKFSRPTKKYIWIKVVASTFVDQSEFAKSGYIVRILNNIMAYGNTLKMGDDVVLQRIIGKCVEVEGIGSVTVSLGTTARITDSEPSYSANNITIQPNEEAIFDKSLITIS